MSALERRTASQITAHLILVKDNGPLRVYPNRKQRREHNPFRLEQHLGILGQRESVPSDDGEYQLVLGRRFPLQLDPVEQGAEVVS